MQPGEQANQQSPSGLTGLGGKVDGPGSASSVRKEGQRPEQSSPCPPSKPWPSPELWDGRRATRQTSSTWQGGLCGVLRDQAGRANLTLQRSTQPRAQVQVDNCRPDVQPPCGQFSRLPLLCLLSRGKGGPSLEENVVSQAPAIFMFIQRSVSDTARDRTIRPKP